MGSARILPLYSLRVAKGNQREWSEGLGKPFLCILSYEKKICIGEEERKEQGRMIVHDRGEWRAVVDSICRKTNVAQNVVPIIVLELYKTTQ